MCLFAKAIDSDELEERDDLDGELVLDDEVDDEKDECVHELVHETESDVDRDEQEEDEDNEASDDNEYDSEDSEVAEDDDDDDDDEYGENSFLKFDFKCEDSFRIDFLNFFASRNGM